MMGCSVDAQTGPICRASPEQRRDNEGEDVEMGVEEIHREGVGYEG